jgi:urea transport system permease protein
LLLAALGLTLTFGQMGVINMANGEFLMAGAYATYVTQQVITSTGVSVVVGHPAGLPGHRAARVCFSR